MKKIILRVAALLALPAALTGAVACGGTPIGENKSYYLQDDGIYPAVSAPYEEESRAAIERWKSAKSNKEEVAKEVAAELYAYACYNEEYLDRYVYFSSQTGYTDLGNDGYGNVTTQNYKLIINADEQKNQPGYKYHYTIKKVNEADGKMESYKNLFEQGRLRFVTDTTLLYRFECEEEDTIKYVTDAETGEQTDVLTCDWVTGKDWGSIDPPIEKREGEKLTLSGIEEDITAFADNGEAVIHGNVNILADNILRSATITEGTLDGHTVYEITMELDIEVANADKASQTMLKNANEASECKWIDDAEGNGPTITFQIWDNGLMKYYRMDEQWQGTMVYAVIFRFEGKATSSQEVWYSYSDGDTDMTEKLAMLDAAKQQVG